MRTCQATSTSNRSFTHTYRNFLSTAFAYDASGMVLRLLGFVVSVGADVDCFLHLLPRSVDGLLRLALQFL